LKKTSLIGDMFILYDH